MRKLLAIGVTLAVALGLVGAASPAYAATGAGAFAFEGTAALPHWPSAGDSVGTIAGTVAGLLVDGGVADSGSWTLSNGGGTYNEGLLGLGCTSGVASGTLTLTASTGAAHNHSVDYQWTRLGTAAVIVLTDFPDAGVALSGFALETAVGDAPEVATDCANQTPWPGPAGTVHFAGLGAGA